MAKNFTYPQARKDDIVDDYHGTPVPDPYRWLEDPDSEETLAWVHAQNDLTFSYLEEISARDSIHQRLTALWNSPHYTPLMKRDGRYFYFKNNGLQNQSVLVAQNSLDADSVVVLDPNTFSDDGTTALVNYELNDDGSKIIYTLSEGGSDWQEIRIRNTQTAQDYAETLQWSKFTNLAWLPDGSGFYYSRYPQPGTIKGAEHGSLYNKLYFHKLGTPQTEDPLIYERPDEPEYGFAPFISDDEQYLVMWVWHGSVRRNRIYYRPLNSDGDFTHLLDEADAEYDFLGNDGAIFYFKTDLNAPKGRIIAIDIDNPARENWREIIPEHDDTILFVRMVNDRFVIVYMHNAYHRVAIFERDGAHVRDIEMPMMGTIETVSGKRQHNEMFIDFQSYLYPPTVFRYDFETDSLTTWRSPQVNFPLDDYETRQVFYPSKDGTRVSMFITHKKGLTLDGDNPTLLFGYGGFSISYTPAYHAWTLSWLEMGGVYAVPNLRGGSEYGDEWHRAGMLDKKQNVFDDFISAGEWLIDNGYTSRQKLAIKGRSNGGLLVGACMTQRPELYGAVICIVPVADMLRFHKFTAGRFWTYEYGNAEENADHFKFMIAYSPLHNVKAGVTYPPILVTTADKDDRVVPLHSKKFTATLQANDTGDNPILLRLDLKSGHGFGKPTSKWIDEWADIFAFLHRTLAMEN